MLLAMLASLNAIAQNIGIGTHDPKSKLHVAGTLRIDSLANPTTNGIVLHDRFGQVYSLKLTGRSTDVLRGDGTFISLDAIAATGPEWLTTGNAGVDESINFLGTTDAKALLIRVNNIKAGIIHPRSGNIAFGLRSLQLNTLGSGTGYSNIALGTDALKNNVHGHNLIAIGDSALFNQPGTTTDYFEGETTNLAIGSKALFSNKVGSQNVAIGDHAMYATDNSVNTAVGSYAMEKNTGNANSAFGANALRDNTSGYFNTAIGHHANYFGGTRNTVVGMNAMGSVKGTGNVVVGQGALEGEAVLAGGGVLLTANYNTVVGYQAYSAEMHTGSTTIGHNNVAVGAYSLEHNDKGTNNTSVGYYALTKNVNGRNLVAVGDSALYNQINNTSGLYGNTAVGSRSMFNNTSGFRNTALGYQALYTTTTGGGNTALGNGADVTGPTISNSVALGFNAKVNASNKVRIGNASITKIEGQVPFTVPSDGRYKFNIREDVKGLAFIMRLRPVTYQFDVKRFDGVSANDEMSGAIQVSYDHATMLRRTGFIAQEVESAAMESGYNFSGVNKPEDARAHYSLSYESFVVPLVKAVQEQQIQISKLNEQLKQQDEQIKLLISELREMKNKNH